MNDVGFYVYAKRGGNPPRPLAGPFATRHEAIAHQHRARAVALARHYLQRRGDVVYTGPAARELAGRPGIVNHLLGLPIAARTAVA